MSRRASKNEQDAAMLKAALDEMDPFVSLAEASDYMLCDCGEFVEIDCQGEVDHDHCWAAAIAKAEERADWERHSFGGRA